MIMERATFGAGCLGGVDDPIKVNYDRLLDVFFANHDATTVSRQSPDHGSPSCSVLFERQAWAKVEALTKAGRFRRPIVTAIEPFRNSYRAEEYHQRYFEKNGLPSCHVNIPEP